MYINYDTSSVYPDPGLTSIILYDVQNGSKQTIINNDYFISEFALSTDGENVLFASARIGDKYRLKGLGYHAAQQLYKYNLSENRLGLFFNGDLFNVSHFRGLEWEYEANKVYFSDDNNVVYCLNEYKGLDKTAELDKNDLIQNLILSNNYKYMAIEYSNYTIPNWGFVILDLANNNFKFRYNSKKYIHILGWSSDSSVYIDEVGEPFDINISTAETKSLDFTKDFLRKYTIEKINFINKDKGLLLLGVKKYLPNSKTTFNISHSVIAEYNFNSKKMDVLMEDKTKKSNLTVIN